MPSPGVTHPARSTRASQDPRQKYNSRRLQRTTAAGCTEPINVLCASKAAPHHQTGFPRRRRRIPNARRIPPQKSREWHTAPRSGKIWGASRVEIQTSRWPLTRAPTEIPINVEFRRLVYCLAASVAAKVVRRLPAVRPLTAPFRAGLWCLTQLASANGRSRLTGHAKHGRLAQTHGYQGYLHALPLRLSRLQQALRLH